VIARMRNTSARRFAARAADAEDDDGPPGRRAPRALPYGAPYCGNGNGRDIETELDRRGRRAVEPFVRLNTSSL
jgi:hypothetical protein